MSREEHATGYSAEGGAASAVGTIAVDRVTTWLIVLNIIIYVLDQDMIKMQAQDQFGRTIVVERVLSFWGSYSNGLALLSGQVWRFITFQFLHENFLHIAMNMLGLYFFGPLIETVLGSKRFVAFYLLCGVTGALAFSALSLIGFVPVNGTLIGASAGVFGVLMASAQIAPNETVLIFGIVPMKLRALAILLLAIAVYTIFTQGKNAGGEAAHLGGAVMGWLLIRNPGWLSLLGAPPDPKALHRGDAEIAEEKN